LPVLRLGLADMLDRIRPVQIEPAEEA
jgi:hypothetical protein